MLAALAGAAFDRPGRFLVAAAVLAACALALAAGWLRLRPGHHDLIDADAEFHARYRAFEAAFGHDLEYALVLVDRGDGPAGHARARAFLDAFATRAAADAGHFARVVHRLDLAALRARGLHFLAPAELTALADRLERAPWLGRFAGARDAGRGLTALAAGVRAGLRTATRGEATDGHALADLAEGLVAAVRGEGAPAAIAARTWAAERPLTSGADGTLDVARGRFGLALVEFREDLSGGDAHGALAALRAHLDAARAAHPGVEARLAGRPVLNADEMATTQADMTLATLVALALVGGLFAVAGRSFAPALACLAVLAAAMAWTLGAATLAVGHLNLLSIVFFVVLIGLGVDFAVHMAARQQELRALGEDLGPAVRAAAASTGRGLTTAAVSTAVAFFAVGLSAFRGIRELGIISGLGVLASWLATFTVWPALCGALDRRGFRPALRPVRMPGQGVVAAVAGRPALGVALAVALTVPLAFGVARVRFDGDLLALQDPRLESVRTETEWLAGEDFSSWFGVLLAADADAARALKERLAARPDLAASVVTASDWVPAAPPGVTEPLVRRVAAAIPVVDDAGDPVPLPTALHDLGGACADVAEWVFEAGTAEAATVAGRLADAADALRALPPAPGTDTPPAAMDAAAAMAGALAVRLRGELEALRAAAAPDAPTVATLPPDLQQRFIAADGRHLVQVFPARSLWDDRNLAAFCDWLESIDPASATGVPFQVRHAADLMRRGYRDAAGFALAAIVVLLLLDLRSARHALLALLPLGLGAVWMLGAMGWADVPWNLANLLAVPLLIGTGVDTGVHLVHRWREGAPPATLCASATGHAVALSAATTMLGFGSLLLAHHRGIWSLGLVMVLGLGAVLAAGLLVLPAAMALWPRRGSRA